MSSSTTARAALVVMLLAAGVSRSADGQSSVSNDLAQLASDKTYVDVSTFPNVHVSLRYASENNFMGKNVYGEFHGCFLHKVAADKFHQATRALQQEKRGWKFLIFDCLRPRSLQTKLFAVVRGTSQQPYVADPRTGSLHNYGFAIDLSLEDVNGSEIDMGTRFDDFSTLAQPLHERENLTAGRLTKEHVENRLLLRKIMSEAGFIQLPIEWWHYDALPKLEVKAHYKIVE
jgi:D-alanyl-D-alanine dipeptidase